MKQYKVEALVYYTKLTLDKEHIVKSSTVDIQAKLDDYAARGWRLVSTNATDFGFAVYIYTVLRARHRRGLDSRSVSACPPR